MTKRIKTGGRTKKAVSSRKITFKPTDEILAIWDSWTNKAAEIERAIISHNESMKKNN